VTRRVRLAAGVVLTMTVVTACTGTTSGSPSPSPSAGSGPSSPAGVTPSEEQLPPRPREITLDGVDPCTLWTGDQLTQLAMAPMPRKNTTTAGNAMCAYDAQDRQPPRISLNAVVVLDHDAGDLLNADRGDTIVSVDGFPAVRQSFPAAGPRPCVVVVSTAQGQSLEVMLNYGSTEAHLSGAQACELTSKAATFAMQTLQTQR